MNTIIEAITVIGFPGAICLYSLFIINRTIATMQTVVNENTLVTKELAVLIRERLR